MPTDLDSYWDLIDPAWDDLCTGLDDPDRWAAVQSRHPRHVVLLFAAHYCQSEVRNGGWLQFLLNSTGIIGPEATEGFAAIGMPRIAGNSQAVADALGKPFPRERAKRWAHLATLAGTTLADLKSEHGTGKDSWPKISAALANALNPAVFDALSRQFLAAIDLENGGFEDAATDYANRLAE